MRRSALTLILLSIWISASAAVTEREIDYRSGDVVLKGSIAYDDSLPLRRLPGAWKND